MPIPGAVASDVYLGYEPDPPFNVQAQMVEAGILVTWNPPPTLPGAFDPGASPPLGWYHISVAVPGGMGSFTWTQGNWPMSETSHLIPFHRQDFGPGDEGRALGEMDDGIYDLAVHAASVAPEGTAGHGRECQARDTGEDVRVIIEGEQVRVEKP